MPNRKKFSPLPAVIAALSLVLAVLVVVALCLPAPTPPAPTTAATTLSTTPSTTAAPLPTEPPVTQIASATILNTGDMLMHKPVFQSVQTENTYRFGDIFSYVGDYILAADFAVANLETTLAGSAYPYSGYPQFNCPDGIAAGLKSAGFDLLLTANNHSYDTGNTGFFRTQQVLRQENLAYLGTVSSEEDALWQIHDIGGIRVGMMCYTYETDNDPAITSLNGIPLGAKAAGCIGTFAYGELDRFYGEMEENMAQLTQAGAEAVVLYIHWGQEYQLRENEDQRAIAQKMCDLGIDVIVGGHSHVVQPMVLLTSRENPAHKTICLYSTGNALSNQSRHTLETAPNKAYTEDGLLFSFTFVKYSDGTVIVQQADVLPTWVYRYSDDTPSGLSYRIIPVDKTPQAPPLHLPDAVFAEAQASYERTMSIVGSGLSEIQTYLRQLVAETEAALGIT